MRDFNHQFRLLSPSWTVKNICMSTFLFALPNLLIPLLWFYPTAVRLMISILVSLKAFSFSKCLVSGLCHVKQMLISWSRLNQKTLLCQAGLTACTVLFLFRIRHICSVYFETNVPNSVISVCDLWDYLQKYILWILLLDPSVYQFISLNYVVLFFFFFQTQHTSFSLIYFFVSVPVVTPLCLLHMSVILQVDAFALMAFAHVPPLLAQR